MPDNIENLINENLSPCKLKVLVFGPSPSLTPANEAIEALRNKRIEIQTKLRALGHTADFPEDLVKTSSDFTFGGEIAQEIMLMKNYDLVIVLVESPGSNTEIGMIASRTDLCRKTQCFIRSEYSNGLPGAACRHIAFLGGCLHQFEYPKDVTECNLLTNVEYQVRKVQLAKFLS